MTTTSPCDGSQSEMTTGFTFADEHLVMHQFMYESSASDASSRGFLPDDDEPGTVPRHEDASLQTPARVRIRAYP